MFKFAKIIMIQMWLMGIFIYPVVWLLSFRRKRMVSPITNPILLMSAKQLAYRIRTQKLNSEEVMNAYIKRCEEVNPLINAIVQNRYDKAIADAIAADRLIASGQYPIEVLEKEFPLLGVPLSVKESIAVETMSHDAGKLNNNGNKNIAIRDADSVALLRASGAIPFVVTNTPELCMLWETFNNVTGLTRNPHDSRKTAGGSSGGEAALLASGASVIGLGTDAAGSLRLPSMYNGIFCHKPTSSAVSVDGTIPQSQSLDWLRSVAVGPMVRYAEDMPLMMEILNKDAEVELKHDSDIQMKNIRLYYIDNDGSGTLKSIDSDVKKAFERVVNYFENKHSKGVTKVKLKYFKEAVEPCLLAALKPDVDSIFEYPVKLGAVLKEMIKKMFGCSKSNLMVITYGFTRIILNKLNNKRFEEANAINEKIRNEIADLLQDNAVCFFPAFVKTATYHYDYLRHFLSYSYLSIFNVLGLPSTGCPIGKTKSGMPVGLQIISGPGCDHLGMIVAQELEEAFGGWIPPSGFVEQV